MPTDRVGRLYDSTCTCKCANLPFIAKSAVHVCAPRSQTSNDKIYTSTAAA